MNTFFQKLKLKFRRAFPSLKFPFCAIAVKTENNYRQILLAQSKETDELQIVHAPAKQQNRAFIYSVILGEIVGEADEKTTAQLCRYFGEGFCIDGEIYELKKIDATHRFTFLVYDTSDFLKGEVIPHLFDE
jgi:hypothetical protein